MARKVVGNIPNSFGYTVEVITTFSGENDVLRQEALRQMVSAFVAEHTDMGLERLDGEEASYDRMHEAAQSLPFLAAKKLIVLRTPGANKEFAEKLDQFIADIPDTNDVVLIEPKPDKRSSYYKALKKQTTFRDFPVLDAMGLARFATEYAKSLGAVLSSSDARLLIDRVGVRQLIVQHEIDKLTAYSPNITRTSIELLTERTPQSSIFELLDAAFAGDSRRALGLYREQRDMRVEPQQILAMLVWQLHILALVKAAGSRSPDTVAAAAKISPFTTRKSAALARKITIARLKQLITTLREFDIRLKSEAVNADEVVQYYLLSIAG